MERNFATLDKYHTVRASLAKVFRQSMASANDPDVVASVVAGRLSLLRVFAPAGTQCKHP
jgi:hypothetical protein